MKIYLLALLLVALGIGCTSASERPITSQLPQATPTEIRLPYNLVTESAEYCQAPYAFLSLDEVQGASEEEIVHRLIESWLIRYRNPQAHPYCRIEEYMIGNIEDDPARYSAALEPRGDFMRLVVYAVKLIQVPTDWLSFSGELDAQNWLHLSQIVAVTNTGAGYKMEFANP